MKQNMYYHDIFQVVAKVWGYRKIWLQTGKIFEMGQFSLPSLEYATRAFWIDLDPEVRRGWMMIIVRMDGWMDVVDVYRIHWKLVG